MKERERGKRRYVMVIVVVCILDSLNVEMRDTLRGADDDVKGVES